MLRSLMLLCGGFVCGIAAASLIAFAARDTPASPAATPPSPPAAPGSPPGAAQAMGLGQMLVQQIKSVDGCLGVETAALTSGKNVIIAWFENAEAARRWYDHPVHQRLMSGGQAGQPGEQPAERKALAHVPPDVPVMVMACITMSERPEIPGVPIPISQISIEMYTPLDGGAAINGRLTPESINIEHMRRITLKPADSVSPVEPPGRRQ